ncbi:MAG: M1 family metallopeptidase [Bacteroidetes bacterium]|nr:M1 family metallopeptidase [Bacteroidota bacterium]
MKRILYLLLFAQISLSTLAQKPYYVGEYQSPSNPFYWKNKIPFIGYWQQDVDYKIKASLDDSLDMIDAELTLVYYNNSPDVLHEVYFHLYQNAFQPGSYYDDLQKNNHLKTIYGKNEKDNKGEVIEMVTINGTQVKPTFDNTIMKLILPQPLQPNGLVEFKIKFKSYFGDEGNVRRRMKMFKDAWGNKQYDGVHWYPRICVYDRKFGWETDQHLGREFYGDFGSYEAELTLPSNYINEATGELLNENEMLPELLRKKLDVKNFANKPLESKPSLVLERNGTKTWKYKAVNVHDFAFTCDPTYRLSESSWNGIRCIGIVQEPHAAGWQNTGAEVADIVKTFSTTFGMYAYPKMVAADARDGMEYPMLTLDGGVSPGYMKTVSHEVGHNWFFGIIGNNETYRACLDEGFTQFINSWYMEIYNERKGVPHYRNKYLEKYVTHLTVREEVAYSGYILDAINDNDETLNQHSDGFNGAVNHGGGYRHVYYKTATMLWNLQYVLGDELFLKAMQNYFNEFKICHPYIEDFRNSIIHYTHADLNWFFDQWFETNKHIDYEVENVQHLEGDQYEITLERLGRMQMPIDFTVTAKDGFAAAHL